MAGPLTAPLLIRIRGPYPRGEAWRLTVFAPGLGGWDRVVEISDETPADVIRTWRLVRLVATPDGHSYLMTPRPQP